MARKFIVDLKDINKYHDNDLKIIGSEVKHINVLRHKISDIIIINNANYEIKDISKKYVIVTKLGDIEEDISRNCNVTLFQSFLKGDKMETVIREATEVGSKAFVGFFSTNTVVKLDSKAKIKRKLKLENVCLEAIKQCGRTDKINVFDFINFNDMLIGLKEYDVCIFAYEKENTSLKEVINNIKRQSEGMVKNIAVIIGPEGGFTEDESKRLKSLDNVYSVSLGNIILKSETAGIYLESIIMYEFEK